MSKALDPTSFPLDIVQVWSAAFIGTLGCIFVLRGWPFFQAVTPRKDGERTAARPRFFRLGGLALFLGFLLALFVDERLILDLPLQTLIGGGILALCFGLLDDIRPLHWSLQLCFQAALGLLLFFSGMAIESIHVGGGKMIDFLAFPWPGFSLWATLLWIVLVMNAVNWVDGVDGLMGGVIAVALAILFILSLRPEVNQPTMALLTAMLLGGVIAFLVFNWFPAKMIAGTSGTAFLGFMLAALSVYAGTKVATALLVLVIPILDALIVIGTRLYQARSPFLPGREHFHHVLLARGWPPHSVASLYIGCTLLMGILALSTRLTEKVLVLAVVTILFVGTALRARNSHAKA